MPISDLVVDTFLLLRDTFFDKDGMPIPFKLREKRNTQDDPFDEYVANILSSGLKDTVCQKSPGPLISPDLTVYRPEFCDNMPRDVLKSDTTRIVAIEVKKLERIKGKIARASGMDYNSTPPCGTVRIYDSHERPLDVRGFYLFVAQEKLSRGNKFILSALALCDGDALNDDFDYYLKITGQRSKEIGLGTYGDGINRVRPMLVFSNPLGASQFDHAATLINQQEATDDRIGLVFRLRRSANKGKSREFFAYRKTSDIQPDWSVEVLDNPFPQPENRVETTQSRGKFVVQINPNE
jgi:hypothetical protein